MWECDPPFYVNRSRLSIEPDRILYWARDRCFSTPPSTTALACAAAVPTQSFSTTYTAKRIGPPENTEIVCRRGLVARFNRHLLTRHVRRHLSIGLSSRDDYRFVAVNLRTLTWLPISIVIRSSPNSTGPE